MTILIKPHKDKTIIIMMIKHTYRKQTSKKRKEKKKEIRRRFLINYKYCNMVDKKQLYYRTEIYPFNLKINCKPSKKRKEKIKSNETQKVKIKSNETQKVFLKSLGLRCRKRITFNTKLT